ncbi:hypothetical protein RBB77_06010 [Tunturibacter psychrotolerans]|uniref:SHSP domain-containing protein n=1 Tax=Tunturiibacter psychrotolerans TaxID=3069686 RepID=A0AAU7ZUB4_9BACT
MVTSVRRVCWEARTTPEFMIAEKPGVSTLTVEMPGFKPATT